MSQTPHPNLAPKRASTSAQQQREMPITGVSPDDPFPGDPGGPTSKPGEQGEPGDPDK